MKTYAGKRIDGKPVVDVAFGEEIKISDGPLRPDLSQKVWNHSPDGFEWGYAGSGPAQLALAILLDFYGIGSMNMVTQHHQAFKWHFISKWPREGFTLEDGEIVKWMREIHRDGTCECDWKNDF